MRRLLSRIAALIKPEAKPLFAGYSLKVLQSYFVAPLSIARLPNLPMMTSLEITIQEETTTMAEAAGSYLRLQGFQEEALPPRPR